VHIDYHEKMLSLTITDTNNRSLKFSTWCKVDIPNEVGSKTAYVGFTGGSGDRTSTQEIINWSYTPGPP